MTKILFTLLLSVSAYSQNLITNGDIFPDIDVNKNFIVNPMTLRNLLSVTATTHSLSRNATSPIMGTHDFQITASAAGNVAWTLKPHENFLTGQNCEFKGLYNGGGGTWTAEVFDGTNILNSISLAAVTQVTPFSLTFPCGSGSPTRTVRFRTTASAPQLNVDNLYYGVVTSIGQFSAVSEPINAGAMTIGAVTTPPTKATTRQIDSVTYVREGKYAYITYRYSANPSTGSAAGSGTYLWSLPAGLVIDTTIQPTTGGNATDSVDRIAQGSIPADVAFYSNSGPTGGFAYYVAAYNSTQFFVRYQQLGSLGQGYVGSTAFPLTDVLGFRITIKVPIQGWSASQSAAAANQTDFGWRNAGAVTITGSTTNPTKGTVTIDEFWYKRTGPNLEFIYNYRHTSAGTIGSGDYIYTLPSVTGCTIDTNITRTNVVIGANGATDNSSVGVAGAGSASIAAGTGYVSIYSTTQFRLAIYSTSPPSTIQTTGSGLYGLNNTNIMYTARGSIPCSNWAENQRAPTLIGSVTSNAVGALRTESATITTAGVVTEIGGSDWINGNCTNVGSLYTCTLNSGTFSAAPSCMVRPRGSTQVYNYSSSTASVIYQGCNAACNATIDVAADLICMGPR